MLNCFYIVKIIVVIIGASPALSESHKLLLLLSQAAITINFTMHLFNKQYSKPVKILHMQVQYATSNDVLPSKNQVLCECMYVNKLKH